MKVLSNVSYVARLALTLLVITAVIAGLLALVDQVTEPRIRAIELDKTRQAISAVLPDGDTAVEAEVYTDPTGTVRKVYETETGYAVEVAPNGFGGEIDMMVGVSRDGTVLGISIISHSETPGLGAVAAAGTAKGQAFRDQFAGQSGSLAVSKDGGTIDALTSATITSRAITTGVNTAIACVGSMA